MLVQVPRLDTEPCRFEQSEGAHEPGGDENCHTERLKPSEGPVHRVRANKCQEQKARGAQSKDRKAERVRWTQMQEVADVLYEEPWIDTENQRPDHPVQHGSLSQEEKRGEACSRK